MATNADLDKIIQELQQRGSDPYHDGDGWRAKCLCHDGTSNNSLAISADGKMFCHSCEANTGDVLKELGLAEQTQSFSRKPKVIVEGKETTLHDSEQSAIDGLQWSVFQKKTGITPRPPDRLHRYHEADGNHIGTVVLWKFSDSEKDARQIRKHGPGWICKGMTAPRPLFHLPEVIEASSVVVCEGEKSADALQSIGLVTTTPTQGAKSPKKTDWSVLAGKCVTISVDNDQAGREFGKLVIDLLPDSVLSVKVVEFKDDWPELPSKGDAADWVEHFSDVDRSTLHNRFKALPDHFEAINAIVPLKKQRQGESSESDSGRPQIELTLDEKCVNDQAIEALAKRGDIFDHNGSLAVIVDEQVDGEQSRKTIQHLSLATLREIISETCRFFTWEKTKEGEYVQVWERIPRWCYDAVLARGSWTGIRPIRGIVSCPVLRADGSILQTQGYDIESGLYVDLTEAFPDITSDPTSEAVEQAVAALFDVVSDFPFKDSASRSAWLASLFTPLAREAYRGCTGPLFLFDANVRGSGKSLLADINSLIVTGREATRLTAPQNDEEARKRITALVNDSDRIVLIDNITGRFGCASLDAALTGTVWKDRRLGHTELIEAPLRMTWYASGNNVILAADTARRVCHIRLESPLENPEDRSGFKYADIRKHVRKNRPALLAASLTILRGYIAAECPDQNLKPWGSFEGWSDLVRASIVWCGLVDPGETRTELRLTSDSEAGSLRQMLVAVAHVDQDQHGLRTSDLLKIANARDQSYAADDVEMMREAIEMFCGRSIVKANAQHLGNQLSHVRNRVVDQMAFDCTVKRGSNYWFVQSSGGPGGPGGPDLTNLSTRKIPYDEPNANEICVALSGENRSTTSTRSTTLDVTPDTDWAEGLFQ
jgi:5S rRNA maturation endonuclease (ribonuclease M5)